MEWKRNWQLKVLAFVMALLLWIVYGGGRHWWGGGADGALHPLGWLSSREP